MFSKKQAFITLSVTLLSIIPLTYCTRTQAQVSTEITTQNFKQEILQSTLPVILKVSATWCPPCQRLKPLFEQVAHTFKGQCIFASMDFDANPEFVAQHAIDSVPTFMIYYKGELIFKKPGCPPTKEALEQFVQEILNQVLQKTV